MTAKLQLSDLVIATHNPGKVREIKALLEPFVSNFYSAADFDLPEPDETGATFSENAAIKAVAAMQATGRPALADDSGLCINALDGAPGVYSARWAGPDKDFTKAMEKAYQALQPYSDKSAYFACNLALALPDGSVEHFEGRVDGEIVWPPRGEKGFGYDPVFLPEGAAQTFAEMDSNQKQQISHRARAFQKFIERFSDL